MKTNFKLILPLVFFLASTAIYATSTSSVFSDTEKKKVNSIEHTTTYTASLSLNPVVPDNTSTTPVEILIQCLTSQLLWQQLPSNLRNVNNYYILNHGVDLDISENLKINGKPVFLIDKAATNIMANSPYFLFHTLNISENTAFVRIYLAYSTNREKETANIELSFIKVNNNWILKTNS